MFTINFKTLFLGCFLNALLSNFLQRRMQEGELYPNYICFSFSDRTLEQSIALIKKGVLELSHPVNHSIRVRETMGMD